MGDHQVFATHHKVQRPKSVNIKRGLREELKEGKEEGRGMHPKGTKSGVTLTVFSALPHP